MSGRPASAADAASEGVAKTPIQGGHFERSGVAHFAEMRTRTAAA